MTGASGNVGTGVLRALAAQLPDTEVVGVCRRPPSQGAAYERVDWRSVDLSSPSAVTALTAALNGADAVIHLALAVQPVDDEDYLYRANVAGTQAVLDAVVAAGVPQLVYASSLGVYAPGGATPVPESYPDTGQSTSVYSRHKVLVERMLDGFVDAHPDVVVARFRPTVVVQREAAWLMRSLYLGPFVPTVALELLRLRVLPILPLPRGIALQFVHADDVGDAVLRLMTQRARGSFNIAADVLDGRAIADLVGGRPGEVSPQAFRAVARALHALRVVALTPGWYDVAFNTPVMDTSKARDELGWVPVHSSRESALELIDGLADGATGTSAATGWNPERSNAFGVITSRAHDATLLLWSAAAISRALGVRRAGWPDAAVVGANLAAGTPMALDRLRERRRDTVALLAPVTVATAVISSLRGGWLPVVATTALQVLNLAERRRAGTAEHP